MKNVFTILSHLLDSRKLISIFLLHPCRGLLSLCLMLISFSGIAQTAGTQVTMTMQNFVQLTPSSFQYEVYVTNTGSTTLAIRSYSWGLNATSGIVNGGVITHSFISRDASLSGFGAISPSFTSATNHIRASIGSNATSGNEVALPFGVPLRVATMRVSNTVAFPNNFNPFLPATGTAMQLVTAGGKTQCITTCWVNYVAGGSPLGLNYTINSPLNAATSTNLNVLVGVMNPSPTGPTLFILNPQCLPVTTHVSVISCDNYTWASPVGNGTTYTTSGTYYQATPSVANPNCYDTAYLHLTIHQYTIGTSTMTACDSYTWSATNQTYTASGIYTATMLNSAGCDSVHTLHLTIQQSSASSMAETTYPSYTWPLNGITYTSNGTYTHTINNTAGCDSIISLQLTLLEPSVTMTLQNVQPISPNIFEYDVMLTNTGNTALALKGYSCGINHAAGMRGGGTLTHTYLSRDPMLATLTVPAPGYTASSNHLRIIAANAANGNEVNLSAGVAVRIATMRVTNSVPFPTDFIPDFTWQTLTAVGKTNCIATCIITPPGTVFNINGIGNSPSAGSVQGLTGVVQTPCLYLHPSSTFMASAVQSSPVSCHGLSNGVVQILLSGNSSGDNGMYMLDGGMEIPYTSNTFSISNLAAGIHTVTLNSSYGCSHTTLLTITEPAFITTASSVTACASYTWEGVTYTTTGTASHTYISVAGCDSVHTTNFTIYQSYSGSVSATACGSYTWNGTTYTTSGAYTNSYVTTEGCDSLITLILVVHPIPLPVINPSGPLTFCDGNVVVLNANMGNGVSYQWYKDGMVINGATANAYTVSQSGSYTVNETNPTNCSAISAPQVVTVTNCNVDLHLKLFIQGYYAGSSTMSPVLLNEGMSADASVTDSILIELHSPLPPYGLVLTQSAILHTDGSATCMFNYVNGNYYLGSSYYVAVRHRNGLTTWSANPVSFISPYVQYDFSSASSKAYGDNMLEVEPGVWAFFNGELNADDNIDLLDFSFLESDINDFAYGYFNTDLNGDGNVDLFDISVLEPNVFNFVFSSQPAWSGTLPVVSTSSISGINVGSAVCGGNVSSSGGASITARGVCWSMNPNPTVADSKTTNGTGVGNFTSTMTNLFPSVTYYVRAYATSSAGTVYGNQVSFNTPAVNFSDSLLLSFTILGTCSDGGNDATACTFATGIRPALPAGAIVTGGDLTITNLATLVYSWCSEVRFNLFGANLIGANLFSPGVVSPGAIEQGSANFTYTRPISNAQMIAMLNTIPAGGTLRIGYWEDLNDVPGGTDISLNATGLPTTAKLKINYTNPPSVLTTAVSNLANTSVLSGGYISQITGINITARGVCWSVNPNPTVSLSTKTNDGTGTGSFTSTITGLNPGTTYHVRAYATSSAGTVYGNDIVFTTLP